MSGIAGILGSSGGHSGGSNLAVEIGPGDAAGQPTTEYSFPANTAIPAGGTSPYTFLWSNNSDTNGHWSSGGTTAAYSPVVTGARGGGNPTTANYSCTVTDSVGNKATSNLATYTFVNLNGIQN